MSIFQKKVRKTEFDVTVNELMHKIRRIEAHKVDKFSESINDRILRTYLKDVGTFPVQGINCAHGEIYQTTAFPNDIDTKKADIKLLCLSDAIKTRSADASVKDIIESAKEFEKYVFGE